MSILIKNYHPVSEKIVVVNHNMPSEFSPYQGQNSDKWENITKTLIKAHPISTTELKNIVLSSWESILKTSIANYKIGIDIFPTQQMIGFFLQQLVSLYFEKKYPKMWRGEENASDKDMVCLTDDNFSIEIKTSSHPSKIFGNRSYAQASSKVKKKKSGYYLAINNQPIKKNTTPEILKIRFGWLDHDDWTGQTAVTGQQASLSSKVETLKLLTI